MNFCQAFVVVNLDLDALLLLFQAFQKRLTRAWALVHADLRRSTSVDDASGITTTSEWDRAVGLRIERGVMASQLLDSAGTAVRGRRFKAASISTMAVWKTS